MKLSVIQWEIRRGATWTAFSDHLASVVQQAEGSDWILLPELFSLELLGSKDELDTPDEPRFLADQYEEILRLLKQLSVEYKCSIIGGSHFKRIGSSILNVSPTICAGDLREQTKNKLTTWERDDWKIQAGQGLKEIPDQIGITICYDCEFPESGRVLAERGVLLQAIPAFTETKRGFQRVRWSALARATENQIFTAHASLVGSLGGEPVVTTYGTSGVFTPSIEPFPENAVLGEANPNVEAIVTVELDFAQLLAARDTGDVRNWNDRDPSAWT